MNSVTDAVPTVNTTTRARQFVFTVLDVDISPYMLGVLDAERGEFACPELYFIRRADMLEYCEGFEAVAGPTLTTVQFLGSRPTPTIQPRHASVTFQTLTDSDVEATLESVFALVVDDSQMEFDLLGDDDREYAIEDDHDWIRQGC